MNPSTYFSYYGPIAQKATKGKGLFASVMLAQAALESAWGQSELSSKYNNHFGIKADSRWAGKSVVLSTGEFYDGVRQTVNDAFRVYERDLDSFKDRNKFLQENPRYGKAGVFDAATPYEQASRLQSAGYATDPAYSAKIGKIISDYGLERYDKKNKTKWLPLSIAALGIFAILAVVFIGRK